MRAIKYNGNLITFAGKILRMAEWVYNEGIYYLRVIAGSGTVRSRTLTEAMYKIWEEQGRLDNIRVAWFSEAGSVQRTSGIYRFFSKLFTLRTDANDIVQATANSQPYVINGAMVNPNGGSRFMTHPTVSFGAGDAWSVAMLLNWNGATNNTYTDLVNQASTGDRSFHCKEGGGAYVLGLRNANYSYAGYATEYNTAKMIGKQTYLRFTHDGTGKLSYSVNGVTVSVKTGVTANAFSRIIYGQIPANSFMGKFDLYTIESGALTPSQILEEYNLLRTFIPEIATTVIGSDEIATENCQMVATPMGRVIPLQNTPATWATAQTIYDNTYAATSGTVAKKTSAALAAAAMWRSPDADHDKQAVFGKVFNKFATKLMAFDIAAYNTANPSSPWGYHVMTRAEAQALDALDANILKATGTDYWTTANGTNTTGLNLLGSGVINADGTYSNFKGKTRLMTDDDYAIDINDDGTSTEISVTTEGGSLRLVKD